MVIRLNLFLFFFLFVLTAKIINLMGAFIAIFLPFLLLRIHNCSFSITVIMLVIQESLKKSEFSSQVLRFNTLHYGKHSLRFYGPYIRFRLDSRKVKDKPSLQSFKSSIRCINLVHVDLISDSCGSRIICSYS